MILILQPNTDRQGADFRALMQQLEALPGVTPHVHTEFGTELTLTSVYLIGDTKSLNLKEMETLPAVDRAVRISDAYRILGRHSRQQASLDFTYNGVRFSQDSFHLFPGLCAVDTRQHVEQMFRALRDHGLVCSRMGAYKPRTNPYSFQGHGRDCLPYVFELAGHYGIRIMAMEVTHERHVDEINEVLEQTGRPTGVMLQIGTRNTQNFELLKAVGRQREYPVLFKRGFGITLEESLNAAEYLATEGNSHIVFCLRGMKTNLGDPHRNFVDFAHVPSVRRMTRLPVCIDPSHSVGTRQRSDDGLLDLFHITAQGIIAGANMVLVDFHPDPATALVDGPQALTLEELPHFIDDAAIARQAYIKRCARAALASHE